MRLCLAWDNLAQAPDGWASHVCLTWDVWEPAPGMFRYDLIDQALGRRDRPCYLQIPFSMYSKSLGAPVDYTPKHSKRSLPLVAGGKTGAIPDYSPQWTASYIRAVRALADRYKGHPQVAGYWHAAGWGQETQAAVNNGGGNWADAAKAVLREDSYINSLIETTQAALEALAGVPVYLPGTTSPGGVWGHRRRDVIADLLTAGAGYMNCGLASDHENAWGLGARAGQAMYDIAVGCEHVGFEEGPRRAAGNRMEVYWMLLHALAWDADFVNLYSSISAQQAASVEGMLPKRGTRWLVFRDREHPEQAIVSPNDGLTYGFSGEPGLWAAGMLPVHPVTLRFDKAKWGPDRWVYEGPLELRLLEWQSGQRAAVTAWLADGSKLESVCEVLDDHLTLPPGRYHRIDVEPAPLTNDERIAALERRVALLEAAAR